MSEPIAVLFVDDDTFLLRMIRRVLGDAGLDIVTAESADQALVILSGRRIDVLVSDIEMPRMSGLELVAIVRAKYPNTLRMLLSASVTLERAMQAVNEGEVHRILQKPLDPARFCETMIAFADRIARLRREGELESRDARRRAFFAWAEGEAPNALEIDVTERGEVMVDLARLEAVLLTDATDARALLRIGGSIRP
jgi:DNA-binding NtrC family response regulator